MISPRLASTIPGLREAVLFLAANFPDSDVSKQAQTQLARVIVWLQYLQADMQSGLPEPVPADVTTKRALFGYLREPFSLADAALNKLYLGQREGPHRAALERFVRLANLAAAGMEVLFLETPEPVPTQSAS